jgi:hypothetical protein
VADIFLKKHEKSDTWKRARQATSLAEKKCPLKTSSYSLLPSKVVTAWSGSMHPHDSPINTYSYKLTGLGKKNVCACKIFLDLWSLMVDNWAPWRNSQFGRSQAVEAQVVKAKDEMNAVSDGMFEGPPPFIPNQVCPLAIGSSSG